MSAGLVEVPTIPPPDVDLDAFDYSVLPPATEPFVGGTAQQSIGEVRGIVADAILNQPRSLQRSIGPSEIGNPCTHCLAAKLAGWEQTRDGVALKPTIGTAWHAFLEETVLAHEAKRNAVHTTGRRWLTERRVSVGEINGVEITGSCDLFDTVTGTVTDHKTVGKGVLVEARRGHVKPTYRAQAHLYGRGYARAGFAVCHVAVLFWPRDGEWSDTAVWTEPYQEQIAIDALARADELARRLASLELLGGPTARDAYIRSLPRAVGCFDCARYRQSTPPVEDTTLGGLIAPTPAGGVTQ